MAPLFILILGSSLFLPTFVIAILMLHSVARAFVLSAAFTMGALAGAIGAWLLGSLAIGRLHEAQITEALAVVFVAAGAVAGGVLAVYGLGKLSKYPPWKRY